MLDLKDAFARLERAKKHEQDLKKTFNEWAQNNGIQVIGERDPVYARYVWGVVMQHEPSENLALLAGEIFNNLRSALDYLAFQIYQAGGGDPAAKQAKSVAFPIVTEEDRWESVVNANVPNAWAEAIENLKWCQSFVQIGPQSTALPALRGVGATDKHHNLALYAMGVLSISGISPELKQKQGLILLMAQPGPAVKLGEPGMIGMVYLTKCENGAPVEENFIPWSEGVELQAPPPPTVQFGFRASDGSEITIDAVPSLIVYVEEILNRFSKLNTPQWGPSS